MDLNTPVLCPEHCHYTYRTYLSMHWCTITKNKTQINECFVAMLVRKFVFEKIHWQCWCDHLPKSNSLGTMFKFCFLLLLMNSRKNFWCVVLKYLPVIYWNWEEMRGNVNINFASPFTVVPPTLWCHLHLCFKIIKRLEHCATFKNKTKINISLEPCDAWKKFYSSFTGHALNNVT